MNYSRMYSHRKKINGGLLWLYKADDDTATWVKTGNKSSRNTKQDKRGFRC